MGVDLGGGDIDMTEHQLNRTEIRPPLEEMAGEGMAEEMGSDPLSNPSIPTMSFDDLPKVLSADRSPQPVDKEIGTVTPL